MSAYASNASVAAIARRVESARHIVLTTHAKPDGDAMGSVLALARALNDKGSRADVYLMGPIEPNLLSIAQPTHIRMVEREMPPDDCDLAIVADTGAWSQLEPLAAWLRPRRERVIGIDHHSRGDDVAAMRLIDPAAVSTTAMIVPLLDEMNCPLTGGVGGVAEALFVGLATDSGWFRYANAGPEAFELAARLLKCGVNKPRLYQVLEETHGPQRLALEARALASIQYAASGAAAIQSLGPRDFQATGGTVEELTGLVNNPLAVGAVRVSILLAQTEPGVTKLSFRSKPPAPGADSRAFFDVNALAQQFGGGGHVHAAGARVKMDLDAAKAAVLHAVEKNPIP